MEGAGAQAVPIRYDLPAEEITELFRSVNGLLLPGGGVELGDNKYTQTLFQLLDLAVAANKAGDFFPVHGTCFGFQEIAMYVANDLNLLINTDSENLTLPLEFTHAAASSAMFGDAPAEIMDILAKQPVTMNNHHYSLSPAGFAASSNLTAFFNVLSTNVDRNGIEFISTMEAKDMPITATQWHPEKPLYEWDPVEVINHSSDAVKAMQFTAQAFVSNSRSNSHTFASQTAENKALIYNFNPVYTEQAVNSFDQCYFW